MSVRNWRIRPGRVSGFDRIAEKYHGPQIDRKARSAAFARLCARIDARAPTASRSNTFRHQSSNVWNCRAKWRRSPGPNQSCVSKRKCGSVCGYRKDTGLSSISEVDQEGYFRRCASLVYRASRQAEASRTRDASPTRPNTQGISTQRSESPNPYNGVSIEKRLVGPGLPGMGFGV